MADPDIEAILALAISQKGKPYGFGSIADPNDPNPKMFDCASFTRWAANRAGLQPGLPLGSWLQHKMCIERGTMIPLAQAISTRGALLISTRDANGVPCAPDQADGRKCHIAFSLGDGTTIEARSSALGVVSSNTTGRSFTTAALVPGARYGAAPGPTPTPVPTPTPAPTPVPAPGGSHAPRPDEPYLKRPMAGSDAVREMQRLLIQLGMGQLASTGATGNFYSITQEAVRQFQTLVQSKYDGSMAVDGECGPVTWGWLLYLTGNG